MKIKNYDDIVDQLCEYLKEFDKSLQEFQTDLYLTVDSDGEAEIEEFINVSGNDFLVYVQDDSVIGYDSVIWYGVMYTDGPHGDIFTAYKELTDSNDIAAGIGMTDAELEGRTRVFFGMDKDDEPDELDKIRYIEANPRLMDTFIASYENIIDEDCNGYYRERAVYYVDQSIAKMNDYLKSKKYENERE